MMQGKGEYAILAILAGIYLVTVYRFQTTPKYIILATAIFALSYIVWGMIHHLRLRNFHARIMLEYLLVALLGVAIVSTLLL